MKLKGSKGYIGRISQVLITQWKLMIKLWVICCLLSL